MHELRRARALTQQDLARSLNVNQPAVSKLEQRTDMYVSSLRSYIEAVGGRLKIVAEFPEGEVAVTNFSQLGDAGGQLTRKYVKGISVEDDTRVMPVISSLSSDGASSQSLLWVSVATGLS